MPQIPVPKALRGAAKRARKDGDLERAARLEARAEEKDKDEKATSEKATSEE